MPQATAQTPATVRKLPPPLSTRKAALDGPSPMPSWGVNLRDASAGETLEVSGVLLHGFLWATKRYVAGRGVSVGLRSRLFVGAVYVAVTGGGGTCSHVLATVSVHNHLV